MSRLVATLLRDNPRPLIVTPKQSSPGGRTLIAYDGSVPAMRALQLFCTMGLRAERETVVVSVDEDAAKAAEAAAVAVAFLRRHGYSAEASPVSTEPDVANALTAAAPGAGMIVAGAYGHRGWAEWLLGSTTERLLTSPPAPLFIHH